MGCCCWPKHLGGFPTRLGSCLGAAGVVMPDVALGPVKEILRKNYHLYQDGQPYDTTLERGQQD